MQNRRKRVEFPNFVEYFESAEDLAGDKDKGILRLRNGQMAAIYKTDDPHWWLGKVGPTALFVPPAVVSCGSIGHTFMGLYKRSLGGRAPSVISLFGATAPSSPSSAFGEKFVKTPSALRAHSGSKSCTRF